MPVKCPEGQTLDKVTRICRKKKSPGRKQLAPRFVPKKKLSKEQKIKRKELMKLSSDEFAKAAYEMLGKEEYNRIAEKALEFSIRNEEGVRAQHEWAKKHAHEYV